MPEEIINSGSANAGSPDGSGNTGPASAAGQPAGTQQQSSNGDAGDTVSKSQYEDAVRKLGSQGEELGEYREFFKKIAPVLDKLDESPELIQAILDGKIDATVAKAALDGKVTIGAAEAVTAAHTEVKKELGKKEYANATPQEIERMIEEKLLGVKSEFKKQIDDAEETRAFEQRTTAFIESTPDFADYAEKVTAWLDDHPDQTDIRIAYDAVKGKVLQEKARAGGDQQAGEAQKDIAANAAGGATQNTAVINDQAIVDKLIGGRSNPNVF